MKILNSSEIAQVSGGLDQRQLTQVITMSAIAVTNFALRRNKISLNPDSALGFFMGPGAQILTTALSNELCNIWFAFRKGSKTPSYNTES